MMNPQPLLQKLNAANKYQEFGKTQIACLAKDGLA